MPIKAIFSVLAVVLLAGCGSVEQPDQVLIFSKTAGFRHSSIETGVDAVSRIALNQGYQVTHTEDAGYFTEDSLRRFAAVVFLNTTGDVLDPLQQADFERYIQAGGGYLGIHAASDTEYGWPWYGRLVGAYFINHPRIQEAAVEVLDTTHPATAHLPATWTRTDEWYNFDKAPEHVTVLARLDESSYEGGGMDGNHPITWYHEYDGGRAFYTAMGHTEETYAEPDFVSMIDGALAWLTDNGGLDYARSRFDRPPDENRFSREILAAGLDEPMELEILDEDRVVFVERKGNLRMFNRATGNLRTIATIPVYTGQEDGLLGIAKDPAFRENGWIYLFYSPPDGLPRQHVSRFTMVGDSIDIASESIVITIPVQRDQCCHAGGSLEFGPHGNLFISVGDDTNPFASDGFAPIDEREGRAPWDAQRTSANANDLRGKVLRITPTPEGSYTIPDGNLFPEGTEGTRPEIYAMGLRNPYRISVDPYSGYLYWGDVGPDAGSDNPDRGPRGYDHVNQARTAGFWGWPYTRGNRYPYNDYDFAAGESHDRFDPDAPINDSPNNTGIRELPAIQKPFIWYPYEESTEFPWTGKGGRTAMAGPIYNRRAASGSADAFPAYFDGKLIVYEWMRDWINVVTMTESGDFEKVDPFLPNARFNNPTDMAFGPDGALYVLEYGEAWFAQNADARLNRISFTSGNRPPVAAISVDKRAGAAPLRVQADAGESGDPDDDPLRYTWMLDGEPVDSATGSSTAAVDIAEPGTHELVVVVSDPGGLTARGTTTLTVGNEPPKVAITLNGNQRYFWPGRTLNWRIAVSDDEDGTVGSGIEAGAVEAALLVEPHFRGGAEEEQAYAGAEMIGRSDCGACHAIDRQINGPAWRDVATRYTDTDIPYLTRKIINGGSGVWGETVMAAHPQLKPADVETMVRYILATGNAATNYPIDLDGQRGLRDIAADAEAVSLTASYRDRGHDGVPTLQTTTRIRLEQPTLQAEAAQYRSEGVVLHTANGSYHLHELTNGSFFGFDAVDLTDMRSVTVGYYITENYHYNGTVELHADAPDGPLLGSQSVSFNEKAVARPTRRMTLDKSALGSDQRRSLYLVFRNADPQRYVALVDWVQLNP